MKGEVQLKITWIDGLIEKVNLPNGAGHSTIIYSMWNHRLKYHINSRRMTEPHRCTYYPFIIRPFSAEGATSESTRNAKYCQECRRWKLAAKQKRGPGAEERGWLEGAPSHVQRVPSVQRVHTHAAPADPCQVGMWILQCQITGKKSSILGSFSVLTTNCITKCCPWRCL